MNSLNCLEILKVILENKDALGDGKTPVQKVLTRLSNEVLMLGMLLDITALSPQRGRTVTQMLESQSSTIISGETVRTILESLSTKDASVSDDT